jgi:hypothetical protein
MPKLGSSYISMTSPPKGWIATGRAHGEPSILVRVAELMQ